MKNLFRIDTVIVLLLGLILTVAACKKSEPVVHELQLEDATVTIKEGENNTVTIVSGNGGYKFSESEIADIEISGNQITIHGRVHGKVTLTITDEAGKTASLEVIVDSTVLDSDNNRFVWGTVIDLDEANNWGMSIYNSRVAITNVPEKKQYIITWIGGMSVGAKSAAKLKVIEDGEPALTYPLTKLEILEVNEDQYSILFANEGRTGELVFTK